MTSMTFHLHLANHANKKRTLPGYAQNDTKQKIEKVAHIGRGENGGMEQEQGVREGEQSEQ